MLDFLKLIESKGYITVSKELARNIGLDETMILTELISKYNYWSENNQLTDQGYFYITIEDLKKETTLTRYRQTKAINNLKEMNLISTKKQGLPAKRYFKIHINNIKKLFFNIDTKKDKKQQKKGSNARNEQDVKNSQTSDSKIRKLDVKNSQQLRTNNKNKLIEEEEGKLSTEKFSEKTLSLFKQVFGHKIKSFELQLLNKYDLPDEVIRKGIELSGTHNAQSLQYLLDILKEWSSRGITTLEGIERYIRQFKGQETDEDLEAKGYR